MATPLISKISFVASNRKITGDWLNAVQNATRFNGITRSDVTLPPTESDELNWAVNQRDGILDWEINPDTSLGNKTWGGRILASDGVSFAPAETVTIATDVFVWVYTGTILTIDRQQVTWLTQRVEVITGANEQYLWVDVTDPDSPILTVSLSVPPLDSVPLARLNVDAAGDLIEYIDIRPSSYILDFSNRTRSLIFSPGLKTTDYVASEWERILADTTNGSLYIDLPLSPADNAEVSIVDAEGYFHLYPVYVRPAPNGDNTANTTINGISNDAFALRRRNGVYTLVYSTEQNGWYFIDSQEAITFVRGSFIGCGGRQLQDASVTCSAGEVPTEYLTEPDPPLYEIVDGRCWLVFPESAALYANPSLVDTQGIKVESRSARCLSENNNSVNGGFIGFDSAELIVRTNESAAVLAAWETTTATALGVISSSEREILFDLNNRVANAILFGYWVNVAALEDFLTNTVSVTSLQNWYNAVLPLLSTETAAEFADALDWILTL